MASRDINRLHETLQAAYRYAAAEYKKRHPLYPEPVLTATYRSPEEQETLYNYPRDGKDNNGNGRIDERGEKVTNARAGQSPHNYLPALAFDVAFIKGGKTYWDMIYFEAFAVIVKEKFGHVITWGGDFRTLKDAPHFELKNWKAEAAGSSKDDLDLPVLKAEKPYPEHNVVRVIQHIVGVTADGVYGPNTAAAVENWQASRGLKADGIVGRVTYKAMRIIR